MSLSLAKVAGSAIFSQTCFGTIGISLPGFGACGVLRSMTTVLSSSAVTFSKLVTRLPFATLSSGTVIICSYVYTTSAAVIGSPSDHVRPSCRVKIQVLPSFSVVHESARPFVGEPSCWSFCTTGWALAFVPAARAEIPAPLDVVTLDRGYRSDVAQTSPWLLQGAKTLSYAVNMAALREARRRDAQDVIFLSIDGFVLEGPNSTVIARFGDRFVTPPVELGILPGTTQHDAFAALHRDGRQTQVRPLTAAELTEASALWLCSSTRGAAPIAHLDGRTVPVDADATAIMNHALDDRKE